MESKSSVDWIRKSFKGNKVWVAADKDGTILLTDNKALIKYQLNQNYEYRVHPSRLKSEADAKPAAEKLSAAKKHRSPSSTANGTNKKIIFPGNAILIYTDGASSGNPGPSGIGIYLRYQNHEKGISQYIGESTNNIAELTAIQVALSELKTHKLPVRLFTDSAYALGLLTQGWKPKKNVSLIQAIQKLMAQFTDLKILKVKGHAGDEGNEKADRLATSAIKEQINTSVSL